MSLSQRLNKRITLQTMSDDQAADGQPVLIAIDIATVWAEIKDVSGKLLIDADQKERSTQTEMVIRARTDLPENLLVSYKGAAYRVEAVLGQDNRTQKLVCVKVES
jgi:SPP1 family predicted phage head-tail adaptor